MKNVDILAIRSESLDDVFDGPVEAPKDVLISFESDGDRLEAKNETLTLVLDRDIHRSIDHASALAVHLAAKYPARTVLLINTYASRGLLQKTLMDGLVGAKVELPSKWKYRGGIPNDAQISEPGRATLPKNIRILSCPFATLTPRLIDMELTAHHADIVVLNSFEFASLSSYAKSMLAAGLVTLQINRKLSLMVYTQDRHRGLSTYSIGRGAIGMLAPFAAAIWRIFGDS